MKCHAEQTALGARLDVRAEVEENRAGRDGRIVIKHSHCAEALDYEPAARVAWRLQQEDGISADPGDRVAECEIRKYPLRADGSAAGCASGCDTSRVARPGVESTAGGGGGEVGGRGSGTDSLPLLPPLPQPAISKAKDNNIPVVCLARGMGASLSVIQRHP